MAAYSKFNTFLKDAFEKVHDLENDTIKVALSNTAPSATDAVLADITQISAGNGYTAGGNAVANPAVTESSGTATFDGDDVTFTASGGTIGPFQYVILYNDTPTSPADPLIAYYDRGAALTLQDTEEFTVTFNASGIFTAA